MTIQKYPVQKIDDVYDFEKYKPKISKSILYWSIGHLFIVMFFLMDLFARIGELPINEVFVYGIYIFLTIYSLTDLMDQNRWNWLLEVSRTVMVIFIGFWIGDWFGHYLALYFVVTYQAIALLISFQQRKEYSQNTEIVY